MKASPLTGQKSSFTDFCFQNGFTGLYLWAKQLIIRGGHSNEIT